MDFRMATLDTVSPTGPTGPVDMTFTDNGALSHASTKSAVLDAYTTIVARDRHTRTPTEKIRTMLDEAWAESPQLTLYFIAYLRDVRGGKGERAAGRDAWKWLLDNHREVAARKLVHLSYYGRWDDYLSITCGTPDQTGALELLKDQLEKDMAALEAGNLKDISLAAKWAPTEKSKFDKAAVKARAVKPSFQLASMLFPESDAPMKDYRTKCLSPLRAAIDIVETHLCNGTADEIDLSKVPGVAMRMYSKKAFPKHCPEKLAQWQTDLVEGKAKINSGTVDPYQLVTDVMAGQHSETTEAFFRDQITKMRAEYGPAFDETMVVADVSGSMNCGNGTPMRVSIATAVWTASISQGMGKDLFFTFSSNPSIVSLADCETLQKKVHTTRHADWGGSTNLQKTMDLILQIAKDKHVPADKMMKRLIIVSDMQFDIADCTYLTNLEEIRAKFRMAGYALPQIVFWNVNGSINDAPATRDDVGVVMVSGFSKALFSAILKGEKLPTPYDAMLAVLTDERYRLMDM